MLNKKDSEMVTHLYIKSSQLNMHKTLYVWTVNCKLVNKIYFVFNYVYNLQLCIAEMF